MSRHAPEHGGPTPKTHHVVAQIGPVEYQFGITDAVGCHVVHWQNRRAKLFKIAFVQAQGGQYFHADVLWLVVWKAR
jgi:hypothetical protein